ncbi:exosporium protein C [Paenibacillus sp. 19GGS1-52]|uniref:exosporium protein C n=1 Tax=Paenibacillus sp. 19GGS1-52 TaxID=2758563 RepID=UPI001EFA4761|nr:exosporium protein C [Paenibacillus sp. 19GGS1-52]ULO07310.1 exosporium protein C [Paenibacillus sp. 19GGS1-52]
MSTYNLLDYKASVPSNAKGGTAPVILPVSPGILLADLGIFIVPPVPAINRVELKGTLGLQGISGNPIVTLRIFRLDNNVAPGIQIFTKVLNVEAAALTEMFYTASFSTIDFNVPATTGFVVYRLTGEIAAAGNTANVVGPITFTGLAIGITP